MMLIPANDDVGAARESLALLLPTPDEITIERYTFDPRTLTLDDGTKLLLVTITIRHVER